MKENTYNPTEGKFGYMYHASIYFEHLLTHQEDIERKHGPINTGDPNDSTDYSRLEWVKGVELSFAEKEWSDLVRRLRDSIKTHGGDNFIDGPDEHVYFFSPVLRLKGKYLSRINFHISHQSTIEMDILKFNKHVAQIGKTHVC